MNHRLDPEPSTSVVQRVLRALHRGREHGFHFAGNFLGVSFDRVSVQSSVVSLKPELVGDDPAETDAMIAKDGSVDGTALGVLADLALAASVRAALERDTRLATVNMQLQLTGAPCHGTLQAQSGFHGFVHGAAGRQAISQVALHSGEQLVGLGTATFMVLELPAGARIPILEPLAPDAAAPAALDSDLDLTEAERAVYDRARAAVRTAGPHGPIADLFWGFHTQPQEGGAAGRLVNGLHVGNRVGHVQGGVLLGFAQATARAALPEDWTISSITAGYVSPGEGQELTSQARIAHRGRTTAVVRVEVFGGDGRRVLEVLTTHSLGKHLHAHRTD